MKTRIITCERRIQFCAGHRVVRHESKCANPHGHNYVAYFTAEAPSLDDIGRVIDFAVLKERIGGWIDQHWDHGFIMWSADPIMMPLYHAGELGDGPLARLKHFVMDSNPTAENMARFLLEGVCPKVLEGTGVLVTKVRLLETENCAAEVTHAG